MSTGWDDDVMRDSFEPRGQVGPREPEFEVKDSGARASLGGGMVRDTEEGKADYTLIMDGPMYDRWAEHLTKGARKYAKRNWMRIAQADRDAQEEALARFERSAARHMRQYLAGDRDEDHAAAVFFNLNGAEFVRDLLAGPSEAPQTAAERQEVPPHYHKRQSVETRRDHREGHEKLGRDFGHNPGSTSEANVVWGSW